MYKDTNWNISKNINSDRHINLRLTKSLLKLESLQMLFKGVHRISATQRNWQRIPQPGCHCLKGSVPWILKRSMKNRQQRLTR